MKTTLEIIAERAEQLFSESRDILIHSQIPVVRSLADNVPTTLEENGKKVNVVFAGQYGAGKSSLLKYITGLDIKTGGGITTDKVSYYDWHGVNIVDTPGIVTQGRKDHDAITYNAVASADLLIFVMTAEGFPPELAEAFQKMAFDQGKSHEMMLVVNKMKMTALGNVAEQQKIIFDGNIHPVVDPLNEDDLYVSYIDLKSYESYLDPNKQKHAEKFLRDSGMTLFYEKIEKFLADKKFMGSRTTNLYVLSQILSEALANQNLGDKYSDAALLKAQQRRKLLVDARFHVMERGMIAVRHELENIYKIGNDIAGKLTSKDSAETINSQLKDKQREMEDCAMKAANALQKVFDDELNILISEIENLDNSTFSIQLRDSLKRDLEQIKISHINAEIPQSVRESIEGFGDWLIKSATTKVVKAADATSKASKVAETGEKASKVAKAGRKASEYSGTQAHEWVKKVGHFFDHKFQSGEAVKYTEYIGKAGKCLKCVGTVLTVVMPFVDWYNDAAAEKSLRESRSKIRGFFNDFASDIESELKNYINEFSEEYLDPNIDFQDSQMQEIRSASKKQNEESKMLEDKKKAVDQLIEEIHNT